MHHSEQIIGILALQGDFAEHSAVLDTLGVSWMKVRTVGDLEQCDALILPGGESTVMMKLAKDTGLDRELYHRIKNGMPVLATCAGVVLLSDSHLQLMDISVDRNAYGSQMQSFSAELVLDGKSMKASFIRAPKITQVGEGVKVLCEHNGEPVAVQQGGLVAATFHPEVQQELALHQHFLEVLATSADPR